MELQGGDVVTQAALLQALSVQELIQNFLVTFNRTKEDGETETIQVKFNDVGLRLYSAKDCYMDSPLEYWRRNATTLQNDKDVKKTASSTIKHNQWGLLINPDSVFGKAEWSYSGQAKLWIERANS